MTNEALKGILSDYVKMKFETIDDLKSKGDLNGLEKFFKSEEYNKFHTIHDTEDMVDEFGNKLVFFLDKIRLLEKYIVYSVNVETLETNILLIDDNIIKPVMFFHRINFSDKFFEIVDNLDDDENFFSCKEDGVWVNYVQKFGNGEVVSTIELNEYRLNKGLKPIDFKYSEDRHRRTLNIQLGNQ